MWREQGISLDHVTQQAGFSRSEILARLSRELPSAIDRYATDGRRTARHRTPHVPDTPRHGRATNKGSVSPAH
ncbi:hypothetical protein CIW48_01595 [Methylobacterium sp. P1-11]|nr:hypothetical protein CIW48_01595 [Methylobacterium sp. P1-11]